jgi:hypothetical protein
VQASAIDPYTVKISKAGKHVQQHARELITTALLSCNVPPTLLEHPHFKKYVEVVSEGKHTAPSRYLHMQTLKELAGRCRAYIRSSLQKSVTFSIEEDSWSRDGRKFSAITAGMLLHNHGDVYRALICMLTLIR